MNFLLQAIKQKILWFVLIIFIVCLSKVAFIVPAIILGKIIDSITNPSGFALLSEWKWIAAFILAAVAQIIIAPLQALLLTGFVQGAVRDASLKWTKNLLQKEFYIFEGMRLGQFIKGFERGIESHEKFLHYIIITIIPLLIQAVVFAVLVLSFGGIWILTGIISGCLIYSITTHYIIVWRRKHIDYVNDCEDALIAETATLLNAAKAVKLKNAIKNASMPVVSSFQNYAKAAITSSFSGSFLTVTQTIGITLATGLILVWGVVDQTSGTLSVTAGDLVILFSVAGSFFNTIIQIGESYRFVDQFASDRKYLAGLLKLPDFTRAAAEPGKTVTAPASLKLAPCTLSPPAAEPIILHKPIEITYGEKVAIIGESGSGKTTLLEALAGLNPATRAHLSIGNQRVSNLSDEQHLAFIRYNPQQAQFLEGEINHSVFFGSDGNCMEEAFHDMLLSGFVSERNRFISEGAKNISGGEAKRLSLLRILRRPGIINLFDEPTASLDPDIAKPVWNTIFKYIGNNTLIAATHDMQNLDRFDRIIVMRHGKIITDQTVGD